MAEGANDDGVDEEQYDNLLRFQRQQQSSAVRPPQQPRRQKSNNRDPYYYDDDEEEEEDADTYPPVTLNNYASDDDSDFDEYYDDDSSEVENGYGTSNLKEPGNFWSNPLQRPDPGPSTRTTSEFSTVRESRRPRSTADPDLRQRRRSGTGRRGTTFRSGTPPAPKPLADLYHRLFWYGLETDDDLSSSSQGDSRTMFGGTKGKFNGLSYLNNGQAVVPPEHQRPVSPRNERRPQQGRRSFLPSDRQARRNGNQEEYNDDEEEEYEYAYDDYGDDDLNPREEYPAQRMPRRSKDLVTPPSDPPRPVLDRRNSNRGRKRSAVASWWENDGADDQDDDDYDASSYNPYDERSGQQQRPRRRRSQSSNSNNLSSALDTFLGLDRERLRDQAAAYDRRVRNSSSGSSNYRRPQSWNDPDEEGEYVGPSPSSFVKDQRPGRPRPPFQSAVAAPAEVADVIDAEHVVEHRDNEEPSSVNLPSPPSLLTWEERALAVERVPPANVPAWGPMGDLGVDARTKALEDALQDIACAKQVVEERRQRVTMAQDQLAVLRVDAQLERNRVMRLESTNYEERTAVAAREALRRIQRRIEEASRRLRWRQLLWDEAVQQLAQVEARHWALLKAYNPEKARQVVEEAWHELEKSEPAVARYSEKVKSCQQQQSESESSDSANSSL